MVKNKTLYQLAVHTASLTCSPEKRDEEIWLEEHFQHFIKENKIRTRAEGDDRICMTMSSLRDESMKLKPPSPIKIRYWRTGMHYPLNRETCLLFGRALGLDAEDLRRLITEWFNRSDRIFETDDIQDKPYKERFELICKLQGEFLEKQDPEELPGMCAPGTAPAENMRYIYCRNALNYLSGKARENISIPATHLDTRSYQYQFSREMKLFGEISRVSMIRHLLILGMPFVNRNRMNSWLKTLGYMPLREGHRTPAGTAEDLPVLGLLELYENTCTGMSPEQCTEWFYRAAGTLGDMLDRLDCSRANPFLFKHLLGANT